MCLQIYNCVRIIIELLGRSILIMNLWSINLMNYGNIENPTVMALIIIIINHNILILIYGIIMWNNIQFTLSNNNCKSLF